MLFLPGVSHYVKAAHRVMQVSIPESELLYSMQKVKWGVLGCAGFARSTAIPAMLKANNVELTAIASRDKSKSDAFAHEFGFTRSYSSYEALLADDEVQAIYIPLPNGLHGEWTKKAATAGKHCLVEKPFAVSVEEAIEVAEVVRTNNVKVMEAFMWRFHPMHRRVKELIHKGVIGAVRNVRTSFTFSITRAPNVRLSSELNGGGLMDVGCYCISEARFLFDAEPTRVYARADYDREYQVDMLASGILEFPTGRASFDCGFELPFRCDYEVAGSNGRIVCPLAALPGENPEIYIHTADGVTTERFPGVNQYVLEFEHFSRSLLDNLPLDYDTEDAIKQQRVIDAVYRSTRSGVAETV